MQFSFGSEDMYLAYVANSLSKKMNVYWDIVMCSLAEIDQHFRGVYCLHHQGDE
jgi:hypothetical protein